MHIFKIPQDIVLSLCFWWRAARFSEIQWVGSQFQKFGGIFTNDMMSYISKGGGIGRKKR